MIEFEVKTMYGGWELTWLPDDMGIVVRSQNQENRISGSLRNLLEVYGHVRNRKDGHVIVGTGSGMSIEFEGENVIFENHPITVQISVDELRTAFEEVLSEIFTEKDDRDPENRPKQLENVYKRLKKRDIEYDVFETYDELSK